MKFKASQQVNDQETIDVDPLGEIKFTLINLDERLSRLESMLIPETRQSGITDKLVVFANYLDDNKKHVEADRVTKVIERFAFDTGI